MKEETIRYLEMIQNVITRMATNSFSLKGWAITLVAGILALSSKDSNITFFLISYLPIILFWFLDTYYLQLERRYRALFNHVRNNPNIAVDFDMSFTKIQNNLQSDKKLTYKKLFIFTYRILFLFANSFNSGYCNWY